MFIGKVTGHLVSTQKEPAISDAKLLVIEAYSASAPGDSEIMPTGRVLVAIDALGAGVGEYVLVTQGSSARMAAGAKTMPVDAIVIGIIDAIRLSDRTMRRGDGTLES